MTVRVEPTNGAAIDRAISSRRMAAASRYAGSDWVVPDTRDINASRDNALASGPLGGFDRIDGDNSNQTVQFDSGEAFVGGAYVASDDNTISEHTVSLPDNSTTTIYLGWDLQSADTLIIGPDSEFSTHDPRISIREVTTDSTSITGDQDLRTTAPSNERGEVLLDITDTDQSTTLSVDTGTLSMPYPRYEITIERECDDAGNQNYQNIRLNGVSSNDYHFDFFDANNGAFPSRADVSSFGKIAGVHRLGGGGDRRAGAVQQKVIVGMPTNTGGNISERDSVISTRDIGTSFNVDYCHSGSLRIADTVIDRIEVFGGAPSTGRIQIRGLDPFK